MSLIVPEEEGNVSENVVDDHRKPSGIDEPCGEQAVQDYGEIHHQVYSRKVLKT